jgi:hydroxymethylpyrimidine pyrophosphatase-like HAD family hydrolase
MIKIPLEDIVAFAEIGKLKLCVLGIAMGNAIDEVKQIVDFVIGKNNEHGIAEYLEKSICVFGV